MDLDCDLCAVLLFDLWQRYDRFSYHIHGIVFDVYDHIAGILFGLLMLLFSLNLENEIGFSLIIRVLFSCRGVFGRK